MLVRVCVYACVELSYLCSRESAGGKGSPHRHQVDTWRQKGFGWVATLEKAEGRGSARRSNYWKRWAWRWQEDLGSLERTSCLCVLHGPLKVSILNLPLNPQLPALGTPFCSPHSPLFLLFPSSHPSTLPIFLLFLAPCNKGKQTGHFRASDLFILERWLSSLHGLCLSHCRSPVRGRCPAAPWWPKWLQMQAPGLRSRPSPVE